MNAKNRCRCSKQVPAAIAVGYIKPDEIALAKKSRAGDSSDNFDLERLSVALQELIAINKVARLFREQPELEAPGNLVDALRELISSGRYRVLQ